MKYLLLLNIILNLVCLAEEKRDILLNSDERIEKISKKFGVDKISVVGNLEEASKSNAMDFKKLKNVKFEKIFDILGLELNEIILIESLSVQAVSFSRYQVSEKFDLIIYSFAGSEFGDGLVNPEMIFFAPHKPQKYGKNFFSGPDTWENIKFAN